MAIFLYEEGVLKYVTKHHSLNEASLRQLPDRRAQQGSSRLSYTLSLISICFQRRITRVVGVRLQGTNFAPRKSTALNTC